MPCLLIFLAVGLLAGSEGVGRIDFRDARFANFFGTAAMAFILFSGGFDTKWKEVKVVAVSGILLSTLGVLLTAFFVGLFTYFFLLWQLPEFQLTPAWCFLIGCIVSSTDAAAVFSILRSKNVGLKGKLKPLLELESGSNDPMAAFLTVFVLELVKREMLDGGETAELSVWAYLNVIPMFLLRMGVGVAVGVLLGKLSVWLYNRIDFDYDGLYFVMIVSLVMIAYSCGELCRGNGFMAVYTAALFMGNSNFIYRNGVGRFCDGLAWLMQVLLFVMLGLLAFPSRIWEVKYIGLAIAAALMLAARPLAVFLSLIGSRFDFREKLFISWVGLRGGAPIMLATFPLLSQIRYADVMFHLVFFAVLASVLLQGMTLMPMARLLGLAAPLRNVPRSPLLFEHTGTINGVTREFEIPATASFSGRELCSLGLPHGALVLLIRRGGEFFIPVGNSRIYAGDALTVIGSSPVLKEVGKTLETDENS